MSLHPVAFFDSGVGGLTVLKAAHARLPDVSTWYLGDNARAPYGGRSLDEIYSFTAQAVRRFLEAGCPLVVVACNTASAQALRRIQQEVLPQAFPKARVLGVVRPGAESLAAETQTGHVGVFATPITVASHSYKKELAHLNPQTVVTEIALPRLAAYVEAGQERGAQARADIAAACAELRTQDPLIDVVLLGCTHFAFVTDLFAEHLAGVRVLTQEALFADRLADYLARHVDLALHIDRSGQRRYDTTGDPLAVAAAATRFFGSPIVFTPVSLTP